MKLIPNQKMDSILFGEPFHEIVSMFPNSLDEVGGHTDIKGAVSFICKNVYRWLPVHFVFLDSGLKTAGMTLLRGTTN